VSALPYVIVRNRVESYPAWKRGWDAGEAMRRQSGIQSEQLFRNPGLPDEVVLLVEFPTIERAREFAASQELKDVLRESGIVDRVAYMPTEL
jgi:hypothetical protein